MKIIKASAGSGKTYTLSHTYMDFLLGSGDPRAYRHLLAVTFTNKATAEMKERILRDLCKLAASGEKNAELARHYLVSILHDYGAFGVSTIDRFFQQALRSFARELGQFSSYQVELDKDTLVSDAVDGVLDGLSADNPELVNWLRSNAFEQLRSKGYFRLDSGLRELCGSIRGDEYRGLVEKLGLDESSLYSKKRLESVKKRCMSIISSFEKEAEALGLKVEKGKHLKYPTTKKQLEAPGVEELFEKSFTDYATALIVKDSLYGFGVAREFLKEYDALLKERAVMPLDESNSLLKKIIAGSDVPFVYEKTGTRYTHYLLDEFQDTSRMQWDNFLPLLRDADAAGDNLIVGDVKQSIYRWRDSDWRLLGTEVKKEFPGAKEKPLDNNWRSARTIVEKNNEFFEFAAGKLGLGEMYSNVKQTVRSEDGQAGFVKLSFTDEQEEAVVKSVMDAVVAGARLGDIAVLVRGKAEGAAIGKALREAGIAFVSDDTLNIKSSVTVRRLVSLLSWYDDPSNTVGSYLAASMGVTFPDNYHSLVDFCECLLRELRSFDPDAFDSDVLFIGAFMDRLQEWVDANGNRLRDFIAEWRETKNCFTGTPATSGAVRIMTIHKSKGLEFPHVIFPFAEQVQLFRPCTRWCEFKGEATALGSEASGLYPVYLSSSSEHTYFSDIYLEEKKLQAVDNINLFYVAMTRATASLHVIAKPVSSLKQKALKAGKDVSWSYMSELLYAWCGCSDAITYGEPYDFSKMKRESSSSAMVLPSGYESIPLGRRLRASQDASDYFGEDGLTGPAASGRLRGIELHKLLSGVNCAEDLPSSLEGADRQLLEERLKAHPDWFGPGVEARNETTVFGADGACLRPDRVVHTPDGGIIVIDYKFGAEKDDYVWQVRRYAGLYRKMGYAAVRGYVWYVLEDKVVEV